MRNPFSSLQQTGEKLGASQPGRFFFTWKIVILPPNMAVKWVGSLPCTTRTCQWHIFAKVDIFSFPKIKVFPSKFDFSLKILLFPQNLTFFSQNWTFPSHLNRSSSQSLVKFYGAQSSSTLINFFSSAPKLIASFSAPMHWIALQCQTFLL